MMNTQTRFIAIVMFLFSMGGNGKAETMSNSRDTIPYYDIPAYPDTYSAANMVARSIDGLGYRYFWATEGLREVDVNYEPGNDGQSSSDLIDHILNLSRTILNAVRNQANDRRIKYPETTWEEKRKETLLNFAEASNILKSSDGEVGNLKIIFKREDTTSEFPIWNLLNGPLADAIYHTGQLVSFRRSSGNPVNPKSNVFTGKTRD